MKGPLPNFSPVSEMSAPGNSVFPLATFSHHLTRQSKSGRNRGLTKSPTYSPDRTKVYCSNRGTIYNKCAGVQRDTSLSEYLWHNDCSAIRLITPARSNMLCTVSTVEERQACPVTEFGFCIGVVLACLLYTSPSPRDS